MKRLSYTNTQRLGIGVLLGLIAVIAGAGAIVAARVSESVRGQLTQHQEIEKRFAEIAQEFAIGGMLFTNQMWDKNAEKSEILSRMNFVRDRLAEINGFELSATERAGYEELVQAQRRFRTAVYAYLENNYDDRSSDNCARNMALIRAALIESARQAQKLSEAAYRENGVLREDIMRSLDRTRYVLGLSAVAAIVIGVIISTALTRALARPIRSLLRDLEILAGGDLGHRSAIVQRDEIGKLARGLDAMAAQLQDHTRDLEVARRRAEDATRTKDAFLANMSHEIRTPMTAIQGYAEQLTDPDTSNSERLNAAYVIRRNGEHLLGIINDILDLSKIEAGKMTFERTACSPRGLVDEVAALMRVRADAKGLRLAVEYDGLVPETIHSDPTRLRQIMINLIGNALKFTELGGVRLVTRYIGDTNPSRIEIDVIDTGIGMTEEQSARLFQPFSQGDGSTTRKFGGTGLGLTISKRLAELLGGGVEVVRSLPGAGSCFRAAVAANTPPGTRLIDPSCSTARLDAPAGQHAPTIQSRLDGCVILLAEDGPDNQRLIAHLLRKAGAEVTVVDNGRQAFETGVAALAANQSFDIILMDMQMPVMDGYEATGALRSQGYARTIIALTAHAMATDREKCLQAGCDEYLAKPIDRKRFFEILTRFFKGSPAKDDKSATRPAPGHSSG